MSAEETPKSKENEAADNLESEMEERDETRDDEDRAERQDLTQGMDTGTHESTRSGVRWPASYRTHLKPAKPKQAAPEPEGTPDKP